MRLSVEKTKTVPVPNDPDGGFINIRALTEDEIAEIESEAITISVTDGMSNSSLEIDPHKRENGTAIKCLKGWGHMYDLQGAELPFNKSSVELAKKNFAISIDGAKHRFFKWISTEHAKFKEEIAKEEAEALVN